MKRILSVLLVAIILVSTVPISIASTSTPYYNWKQYDSQWGGTYIGTKTIKAVGCAATSVSMLIVQAGFRNESNFDPGTFVTEMKAIGGFSNNDIYWGKVSQISGCSGFTYVDSYSLPGTTSGNIAAIKEKVDAGYSVVVSVKSGGHYVAVRSASSGSVTMMDPNSTATDLYSYYSSGSSTRMLVYKGKKEAPVSPHIFDDKNAVAVGEEITFTYSGLTICSKAEFCFEKNGVLTQAIDSTSSTSLTTYFTVDGTYQVYVRGYYDGQWYSSDKITVKVFDANISDDKNAVVLGEDITFTYSGLSECSQVEFCLEKSGVLTQVVDATASRDWKTQFSLTGIYQVYARGYYVDRWICTRKITVGVFDPRITTNKTTVTTNEDIAFNYSGLDGCSKVEICIERDGVLSQIIDSSASASLSTHFTLPGVFKIYVRGYFTDQWVYSDKITIMVLSPSIGCDKDVACVNQDITFSYDGLKDCSKVQFVFYKNTTLSSVIESTDSKNLTTYFSTPGTYYVYVEGYYDDSWHQSDKLTIAVKDHSYKESKTIPATCASAGTKYYTCSLCGKTKTETLAKDPANHTGETEVRNAVDATCGKPGYTGDTYCLGCGAALTEGTETEPTGKHVWNSGEVTVAPTCAAEGEKTFTCAVCGEKKTVTVAKDPANHTGETEVKNAVAATCGKPGYTGDTYCKGCGALLTEGKVIEATGAHTWNSGEVTVAPSCAAEGEKTFTCTVCGEKKTVTLAKDPANHTGETEVKNAVEATCGKPGFTGDTYCKGCGMLLTEGVTIEPTGAHTWNGGEVTTAPTYNTPGEKTYTCTVCGETKTESIDPIPQPADPDAVITVASVKAQPGKTVEVNVDLTEYAPMSYLLLGLEYDKTALTLTGAKNGGLFDTFENGASLLLNSGSDIAEGGCILTLTFTVSETAAAGEYPITVICRQCYNNEEENLLVKVNNGTITVFDVMLGDITGDGVIDGRDLIRLRKYLANLDETTGECAVEIVSAAADCTGDGAIDGRDLIRLRKYLANLDETTGESTITLG